MGTTFRKDYKVPSHLIDSVHLEFDLDPDSSSVTSTMDVRPNPETDDKVLDLVPTRCSTSSSTARPSRS